MLLQLTFRVRKSKTGKNYNLGITQSRVITKKIRPTTVIPLLKIQLSYLARRAYSTILYAVVLKQP